MKWLTDELRDALLRNGTTVNSDPFPVVKVFTPDGSATWLLTELDPSDGDLAYGLCDTGHGSPELGYVRLSELDRIRGPLGLGVERDLSFRATKPLSEYARDAQGKGRVDA